MKTAGIVKIVVGVLIIGSGTGYFMYTAIQSSKSYYFSVDELIAKKEAIKNHSLRVAGTVKQGTIVRNMQNITLNFTLAGSNSEIPVSYKGSIPDNFAENGEVVVEGRLDTAEVLQADLLITKCESKYKAKVK